MKTHDGCIRGFYHWSESWYSKTNPPERDKVDEIMIGMYHPDGGTTGEFGVRWTMVGGHPVPRLEVFDDSWHALQQFGDLLAWMATIDSENVSPRAFAARLRALGVKDLTTRIRPPHTAAEIEWASWFAETAA
jgi:hypothetical protein